MSIPITETTGTDCLLVVDANELDVRALASTLGKVGFEIVPAPTGAQALKWLGTRRPDLILLDLHLPDMDGFEVCRRIQENPEWAEIPIIFLSASEDKNLVARALESGGMDYITKPFHKQELLSRVRTHLMLKTSHDYARRLAQDKDEMLGMISHHLQNHLVGLHMSAQFLLERTQANSDPRVKLMAENIRTSSSQLRIFLKTFLANAATDHGLSVRMEIINLTDTVIRAMEHYEDTARAKEIVLRADLPTEAAFIRADFTALSQIFDNLLSNAVKFSPAGKEIVITVRKSASHVEFQIRDQGMGFTEEDKVRMFRRYARLSARPTGGEPSTGLGLSIVKKLVHAMNAELVCDSAPQKGTTFTVRFAAVAQRPPAAEVMNNREAQPVAL